MKNILVISASPRKGGNSDVLCDEFIKGAQQAGHKAEKIFLRNFKVNYWLRRLQQHSQVRAERRYGGDNGQNGER